MSVDTLPGPLTDAELRATPVPVSGTVTASGPLTDTQLRATAVPVSGTVTASGPLTDTQLRASAVPVSVASLPLPSGAATSALQAGGLPAALAAGGGLKVEGVAGGVAQPVSAAALPLPAGAATSALQAGGLPAALGAGGGLKVDGSGTALPVSGPLTDTQLRATAVPVSGTVTASGPLTDTQLRATAVPVSGTVTADTELPAAAALADGASAVPTTPTVGSVGLVMNATTADRQRAVVNTLDSTGVGIAAAGLVGQLDDTSTAAVTENQFAPIRISTRRAMLVEGVASGTAQPVSAAALPLPTGAATSALQAGGLPAALGAGGGLKVDGSGTALPVSGTVAISTALALDATLGTTNTSIGATNESSAAADNSTSGLNGLVKRLLARLTVLMAQLPTTLGQTTKTGSLSVAIASNQVTVPSWTDPTSNNLVAITTLAKGAVSRTTFAIPTKFGAYVYVFIGRTGTTALDQAVHVRIRRIIGTTLTISVLAPVAAFDSDIAAAVSGVCAGAGNNAGVTSLTLNAAKTYVAGSNGEIWLAVIDNTATPTTASEWVRQSVATSTTVKLLDAPTLSAHNNTAHNVADKANVFAAYVEGGCTYELIIDYGQATTGDTIVIQALMQTLDSLAVA